MNVQELNELKNGIRDVFSRWKAKVEAMENGRSLTLEEIALMQQEVELVITSVGGNVF